MWAWKMEFAFDSQRRLIGIVSDEKTATEQAWSRQKAQGESGVRAGRFSFLSLVAVVLLTVHSALADRALTWERTLIEMGAKAGDTQAEAAFSFTNKSDEAVEILQVGTSCGCCTAAEVEKKKYLPGESGMVRVKFTFGKRKGPQEKTVIIKTSETGASRYILTFRVEIPPGTTAAMPTGGD